MKLLTTLALALLLMPAVVASAGDKKDEISISFSSEDPHVRLAPRHVARDARVVVPSRNGAAVLLLTKDVVAVQISDKALAEIETKKDANFLEDLIVAGVRLAVQKAVEYPMAHIRSAEIRNGALVLTNDQGKPVFNEIKVNGDKVTESISAADAARFVNGFRALKSQR